MEQGKERDGEDRKGGEKEISYTLVQMCKTRLAQMSATAKAVRPKLGT